MDAGRQGAVLTHCVIMQMGIVGMPNVGKSTLFNVLTKVGVPASNFPFCTIDPNNVGGNMMNKACA